MCWECQHILHIPYLIVASGSQSLDSLRLQAPSLSITIFEGPMEFLDFINIHDFPGLESVYLIYQVFQDGGSPGSSKKVMLLKECIQIS